MSDKRFKFSALFLLSFIIIVPTLLHAEICVAVLQKIGEPKSFFATATDGLTHRGVVATARQIPITSENQKLAEAHGFEDWNLRIYIAPSLEAAQAHHKKIAESNPARTGVYLIGTAPQIPALVLKPEDWAAGDRQLKDSVTTEWRNTAKTLLSTGLYEIKNGRTRLVDPAWVSEAIHSDDLIFSNDKYVGPVMGVSAWCKKDFGAVLSVEKALTLDGTSMRKTYRNLLFLLAKGFKIKVNSQIEAFLANLANMKRNSGQENDYAKIEKIQTTREYLKKGDGFAFELLSPDNKLVAGLLQKKRGTYYVGEGVFYPWQESNGSWAPFDVSKDSELQRIEDPIEYLRALYLGFFFTFAKAGGRYIDISMVTNFTRALGGVYITRDTFEALEKLGTANTPTFNSDLTIQVTSEETRWAIFGIFTTSRGPTPEIMAKLMPHLPENLRADPQLNLQEDPLLTLIRNDALVQSLAKGK